MLNTVGEDKLISDVLEWTPTHGHTSVGLQSENYIHQFCADTECDVVELLRAMTDGNGL